MDPIDFGEIEDQENLYENAPSGHISFLANGFIVKINQTLLTWLGLERSSVLSGKRFQDMIPPGERIFFETQFSPLLRMQGSVEEVSFHLLSADKTRIPTLTSTRQYKVGAQGSIVYRMAVFKITDRKKYENELISERRRAEAATQAKAEFLSMLAHEIRTPLNAVIGVSNLLEGTDLNEEQVKFAGMLKNSSDNLLHLLNSILDLSKIESGKIKIESKEFATREFAQGLVFGWQAVAQSKGISVEANVSVETPDTLIGDPIKISQILTNLIGNAVKFTTSGKVSLNITTLENSNGHATVRCEVQDTGIGISEKNLKHIFEEFKQAEYETEASFGGSGLGLTICQKLAELHGTKIQVQSKVGEGSKFSVDLKLLVAKPSAKVNLPKAVLVDFAKLRGLRVLLADDSRDNLALMGHFFKKWGVEVDNVSSGKAAVEKVKSDTFDVVLMDMRMPDGNGLDAAEQIRSLGDKRKSKIPIIAFSGSDKFDGKELSGQSVFNDTLGKPFQPNDLIEKLLKFTP